MKEDRKQELRAKVEKKAAAPREKRERAVRLKTRIALPLDEAIRRDMVFLSNPVLIQGLALTPAIAAATTFKNALVLSYFALALITPVRVLCDLLYARLPVRLRTLCYALVAAVLFIPAAMLASLLFGTDAYGPGIFAPLLVVDRIVLSRSEILSRETAPVAARNGLLTTLGAALVFLFCGALRELLTTGTLYGARLLPAGPLPVAGTVPGGFILIALLAAFMQTIVNLYRRSRMGGVRTDD